MHTSNKCPSYHNIYLLHYPCRNKTPVKIFQCTTFVFASKFKLKLKEAAKKRYNLHTDLISHISLSLIMVLGQRIFQPVMYKVYNTFISF